MDGTLGTFDVVVIGGGINGAGIACDAAGRGLSVLLVEAGDLAGATSSASSKLVHGGLRYLEQYEFGLVREALREREVLLAKAPHLIRPMRFVLPHIPGMRPVWMIRLGLALYDNLYRRKAIQPSARLDLARDPAGAPLRPELRTGFAYWDCQVDDARLVVANARAAADRGAQIRTRTRFLAAAPADTGWRVELRDEDNRRTVRVFARALVNAAGPWAERVQKAACPDSEAAPARLRLVKGSHIVVPRIPGAEDAYILQHDDGRVVFVIPYETQFSLIGTTDVPFQGDPAVVDTDPEEIAYLLSVVARYFRAAPGSGDVLHTYAGVRPLYDDEARSPSAVTRDYRLDVTNIGGRTPLVSVFGGKITTYRRLAEAVMAKLVRYFPGLGAAWTASAPLPGGALPAGGMRALVDELKSSVAGANPDDLEALAHRYGTLAHMVLSGVANVAGLGRPLGGRLFEREVEYLIRHEWARSPEDILWRRTKAGLHMSPAQRDSARLIIDRMLRTHHASAEESCLDG